MIYFVKVPIKSLPQEWLWCETWCSDESLAKAKTIDLCNNPRTKEPKLTAAMRIAPEWVDYDREIKKLWKRVYLSTESSSSSTGKTSATEFSTVPTTSELPYFKESPVEDSKIGMYTALAISQFMFVIIGLNRIRLYCTYTW